MGLDSTHPLYQKYESTWKKLDDVFEGQDKIKEEGTTYLPHLPSMVLDGVTNPEDLGSQRYKQYILRANFPDDFSEAVRNNHGLLWSKPPTIQLPPEMEYLNEKATRDGATLMGLLSLINEMQLRNGRVGILLDMDSTPSPENKPFISVYFAPNIRNWDKADATEQVERDSLNMVVLDESKMVRQPNEFDWSKETRYRVLSLGKLNENDPEGTAVYRQGLFIETTDFDESKLITPVYRGTELEEIPFVAINASDCLIDPDVPPMLGLANLCLSMYISDADYRQHLYMQGQDTLVRIGASGAGTEDGAAPARVGAGAVMDVALGGDVKYVGVESQGLSEERLALANDKAEAQLKAGQMVNNTKGSQESGEALRTRIGARTASLVQLAKTGSAGLEMLLKICARWMNADPEKVKIQPNLDFSKAIFSGQNLVQTMAARNLAAPLSLKTIHEYLTDQGLTKLTFEEEMKQIAYEFDTYPEIKLLNTGKADQNATQQAQGSQVDSGGAKQQKQNDSGQ